MTLAKHIWKWRHISSNNFLHILTYLSVFSQNIGYFYPCKSVNNWNQNFRPKPEPELKSFPFSSGLVIFTKTGMGTHSFVHSKRPSQLGQKIFVLVFYSTKTYLTEWFHYTAEKICHCFSLNTLEALKFYKYLKYCFGIGFRFWLVSGSVKNPYFGSRCIEQNCQLFC